MKRAFPRHIAAGLLAVVASAACKTATPEPARVAAQPAPGSQAAGGPMADAKGIFRVPGIRQPFSVADVNFMSGMIPHHAQAVLIAGWAPSHGARTDVRILCERIVVAQRDEIAFMQTWLHHRGQEVPEATATHMKMKMANGMVHDMLMPGMLTADELAQLDKARGPEFDRLFLQAMIKHHQGAITMVEELLASYGAAQDDEIYRFSSDVYADQTTEIERMTKMLAGGGITTMKLTALFKLRGAAWGRVRLGVVSALAAGALVVAACGPKSAPAAPPAQAPAAPAPAPAVTPPPATPTPPPAVQTPPPAPQPGAPAAAPAAAAPGGAAGGGRGRGTPPPPPPPPPAVMPAAPPPIVSGVAPTPDPRVGLKAGFWDAAEASWNLRRISTTTPTGKVLGATHSDLAFTGKYAIQGNYNGFEIYDISNPAKPVLTQSYLCPASQNDVSVYRNLLFMSAEAANSRADCGFGGVPDPVSKDRVRGIRIFDIADVARPKLLTSVQTCRGSHTHTVVTQPGDKDNVYIYVSGSAGVRSADELPGCTDGGVDDLKSARFRIEVIKVPLASPEKAAITTSPRIFNNLAPAPDNPERTAAGRAGGAAGAAGGAAGAAGAGAGAAGAGAGAAAGGAAAGAAVAGGAAAAGAPAGGGGRGGGRGGPPTGPTQCHDITVYPDVGLAGGACGGYGLLLDIREAANPIRIDAVADKNMAFWHSATFSNDGKKVLFTDEWGGGGAPRCRDTDKPEWGANAIFTIENGKMIFKSYYKLPAAQTVFENCVAHNGSLIPIPGREIMVQGWYQGGISVFEWTDPSNPKEIAFHDRGPLNGERMVSGGSWSVYWYNGIIVSSEIARGLDIFELVPSPLISQNEIDAAKTVRFDYLNAQEQRKIVWPPSFAMARAFVDQLVRSKGLSAARISAVQTELASAEKESGAQRRTALTQLAAQLKTDASGSSDQAKVLMLAAAITDLAR